MAGGSPVRGRRPLRSCTALHMPPWTATGWLLAPPTWSFRPSSSEAPPLVVNALPPHQSCCLLQPCCGSRRFVWHCIHLQPRTDGHARGQPTQTTVLLCVLLCYFVVECTCLAPSLILQPPCINSALVVLSCAQRRADLVPTRLGMQSCCRRHPHQLCIPA